MTSGVVELSRGEIGTGTEGKAFRIKLVSGIVSIVGEGGISGTSSQASLCPKWTLVSGNSAIIGWTTGGGGGGPGGGGKGGGNSASAAFFLPPLTNHEARLSLDLLAAVELLRLLSPNPPSGSESS